MRQSGHSSSHSLRGRGPRARRTALSGRSSVSVPPRARGATRVRARLPEMALDEQPVNAPPYSAARVEVLHLPGARAAQDQVAVEEPLEIRINGRPVAVTMRTPGHDEELAVGFCVSEGLRPRAARLPEDFAANTVEVDAPAFDPTRLERSFYTTSSCGVSG